MSDKNVGAGPDGPAPTTHSAESRAWLDDRTFAAMWLIGHANMLVFVLGMVRVLR